MSARRAACIPDIFSISADRWESNHWPFIGCTINAPLSRVVARATHPYPCMSNVPWLLLPFVANCAYAHGRGIFAPKRAFRPSRTPLSYVRHVQLHTREGERVFQANPSRASTLSNLIMLCLHFNIWYIRSITWIHFSRLHRLILTTCTRLIYLHVGLHISTLTEVERRLQVKR